MGQQFVKRPSQQRTPGAPRVAYGVPVGFELKFGEKQAAQFGCDWKEKQQLAEHLGQESPQRIQVAAVIFFVQEDGLELARAKGAGQPRTDTDARPQQARAKGERGFRG
jgi:hypothetical protein